MPASTYLVPSNAQQKIVTNNLSFYKEWNHDLFSAYMDSQETKKYEFGIEVKWRPTYLIKHVKEKKQIKSIKTLYKKCLMGIVFYHWKM